jgi:23S rRNA (uracil1939-C5)-methyltransferase
MGSPDQAPDQEWELAGGSDGGTHRWRIPAETPPASSSSRANAGRERDRVSDSAVAAGSVAGLAKLTIRLEGDSLQISPGVFMQANALLWQPLVDAVVHAASHGEPGSRLIELHSGAGFFTLALARRFSHVVAIESNGRAVADLRANLAAAGIANVLTIEAPVEDALRGGLAKPDCVVLDPPRSGLSADAVEGLVALDPRRIVYLSCDPATLARDLRLLCEAIPAYRLTHVSAFDLFPQTPHIEGLAVLEQQ